jgi:hypothetical protein
MFMIHLPIAVGVGDTADVRINGEPARVTWRDEETLVIEPDDARSILRIMTGCRQCAHIRVQRCRRLRRFHPHPARGAARRHHRHRPGEYGEEEEAMSNPIVIGGIDAEHLLDALLTQTRTMVLAHIAHASGWPKLLESALESARDSAQAALDMHREGKVPHFELADVADHALVAHVLGIIQLASRAPREGAGL